MKAILLTLVLAVASGCSVRSRAEGDPLAGLETRIEEARTAEDHEAIARVYEDEAKAALANAERHERMAARYEPAGRGPVGRLQLAQHCSDLARQYRSIAKTAADMASAHREAARTLR